MDLYPRQDAAQNYENHYADDDHADQRVRRHDEDLYPPTTSHQIYEEEGSLPENIANWLLGIIGDHDASSPSLPIVNIYT